MNNGLIKIDESGNFIFSKKDEERARSLKKKIDATVIHITDADTILLKGYVRLGYLCKEVEDAKYWALWNHPNFNAFVQEVGERIRKKRTRIYNAISVARYLLPHTSETKLEDMGITNANSLATMVRTTGRAPSEAIVQAGIEKPVTEFKALLQREFRVYDTRPEERWRDLGGSWWSEEEWATYQQALKVVRDVLVQGGSIKKETPDHIQFKMIILAMSQEVIGSWTPINSNELNNEEPY
jgi:hypothetical protein